MIPGSRRSPGGGLGNPLQYSCLENPIERGAWQAIQSIGSQKGGHDWSDFAHTHVKTFTMIFKTLYLHVWIRSKYLWNYRWNLIMCSGIKNCFCDPIVKFLHFMFLKISEFVFMILCFFKKKTYNKRFSSTI